MTTKRNEEVAAVFRWTRLLPVIVVGLLAAWSASAQQLTTFGSASGVACPGGNVICNGSINFLTTELFFEPETPFQSLKETALTWNEVEYFFDNPYAPVAGAQCNDGSGVQPPNDQGYPTYCSPPIGVFAANVRRPAFGVSHPVRSSQAGAATTVLGLPSFRIHPLNYNAPTGTEQRVLNPGYAGGAFVNTNVCYTLGASCVPPPSSITVSSGASRLVPSQTPEIDYDVAIGRKLGFCQVNPEPVPFDAPFNTAFDSETLTACGSDPGEPGAASLAHNNTNPFLCVTELLGPASLAGYTCEDNLSLPYRNQSTASWYSTPAVPALNANIAMRRQIPAGVIPGLATGAAVPIQGGERLVDPGLRGVIQRYDPVSGSGGLKKPSLRMATVDGVAVGGNGVTPAFLYNSEANLAARGADQLLPSNENDYVGLYASPTANNYVGVTADNYYARKQGARLEAARLGKSLFWDMQVGSDGVQACGSCHAHAGADNRTKNQVNPFGADGIPGNPTNFDVSGTLASFTFAPNYDLQASDFPFHKLVDPDVAGDPVCNPAIVGDVTGITFPDGDPPDHPRGVYTACDAGNIVSDTDDVASSMGVHFGRFLDIPPIGLGTTTFGPPSNGVRALAHDLRSSVPADNLDPIAGFQGASGNDFRRVEPRNTPTIFLAAANFDNFWDGRARHDDNGGSVFGISDPQAHVWVNDPAGTGALTATRQLVKFTSIASLAKGPALSKFEMSFDGRNWTKIGKKLLQVGVTPLANQLVDPSDSILGPYSNQGGSACASLPAADRSPEGLAPTALGAGVPGLCITYRALIRHAFYPALHSNAAGHLNGCYTDGRADIHPNQCGTGIYPAASIEVLEGGAVVSHNNDPFDQYVLSPAGGAATATDTNQFTQMEANFSLFWGQSIHHWATLLVPDDTPFDRYLDLNPDSSNVMGESGEPLLVLDQPSCTNLPASYVRDSLHPACFTEVGNFKRDPYDPTDIVHFQNDTAGHPRMTACLDQVTIAGIRTCTNRVPAGGTRSPSVDPDPLLGLDIFFGSNVSLKNPNFRSARCGACHNAPNLTDNTTAFTHKIQLVDAAPEFERGNPAVEPLMEPLGKLRLIAGFHLESEINGPGQDAIERKIVNESIVPAPIVNNNGNCTAASCSGYSFPDAITVNDDGLTYRIHADLGTGPIAGAGTPVPFTSFGGSFFDNGVYNIGVRPCVASQAGVTHACEDVGRGGNDAFGWPLSLAALLMKNLGGPAQAPGTPVAAFDPSADPACAPFCATGGLFEETGHDQQINPGYGDEQVNPQLPAFMAPYANRITVGDAHPQLDEACGPVGGCINALTDVANAEGFPEIPFDPRAHLSEVINASYAPGDGTIGGPGQAQQGTWPVVNRVGRFGSVKAPQLREVELTGPYFHNGGKLTLRQVVDFYVRGGDFPVTNSQHRDFNILNLNAELQSDLDENEKVAMVDFLLELTDDRVAYEKGPFDRPQIILPLDGTAPESDGVLNRDGMLSACADTVPANKFGPGQQACAGGMFLNIPPVGNAGNVTRLPNFLGIAGMGTNGRPAQRLAGPAAFCGANVTSQYCH